MHKCIENWANVVAGNVRNYIAKVREARENDLEIEAAFNEGTVNGLRIAVAKMLMSMAMEMEDTSNSLQTIIDECERIN